MKKKKVFIYVVLMLTLLCTSVYATVSGSASLTASPSGTVYAGDEINVTFTLSDIVADNGIDSIKYYIDIDEDVIDSITVDNIVTDDDGTVTIDSNNVLSVANSSEATSTSDEGVWITVSPSSGHDYLIIINFDTPITTATDLLTITFNVSEDASSGTYSDAIQYSGIYIYYGSSVSNRNTVTTQSLDVVVGTASSGSDDDDNTNNANNSVNHSNNASNNANNASNNAYKNSNNASNNANNNANNASNNTNNNANNASNNANTNKSSGTTNSDDSDGETSTSVDPTTAVGTLPNTGYKLLLIPIILAIATGLICYKKYNKYNKI